MRIISSRFILFGICLLGITLSSIAHKGATGIIKQRMDVMSEMGDAMKLIGDMVKGKTAYDLDTIRQAVSQLSEHAPGIIEQFPDTQESQNFNMSEALPKIWESKPEFDEMARQLEIRISELQMVINVELNKPELRKAFVKTVKACSTCHDDYRKPKE